MQLKHPPVELTEEAERMLETVKQDPRAVLGIPDSLKADRDFIVEAAKYSRFAFSNASAAVRAELSADKGFMMKASSLPPTRPGRPPCRDERNPTDRPPVPQG